MEPVRLLQAATHFRQEASGAWVMCTPHERGAVRMSLMQVPPQQLRTPQVTLAHLERALLTIDSDGRAEGPLRGRAQADRGALAQRVRDLLHTAGVLLSARAEVLRDRRRLLAVAQVHGRRLAINIYIE